MASHLYYKWKSGLMAGHPSANLTASVVRVALINGTTWGYTAGDWLLSNVGASAIVGTPQNLTSKVVTLNNGSTFDADNVTYTAVASGNTCNTILIYIDTGAAATSNLVALLDSTSITGLPVTTSGSDITIAWETTGIFTL